MTAAKPDRARGNRRTLRVAIIAFAIIEAIAMVPLVLHLASR
jgi:hypothetical protein